MKADRLTAQLQRLGLLAALLGGGATVAGYFLNPREFFGAWLAAYYFWLSMPLGALVLLLIGDLTGGRWQLLAGGPLSAMAATLPLFMPLYLPIIAGLTTLYPWARPDAALLLHNRWYLNIGFFSLRTAVYLTSWTLLTLWRLRTPSPAASGVSVASRPQWISALGLLLMLYTMTYAGIDWLMSTEPDWFSSIYGMIVCASQGAAALALLLVLIAANRPQPLAMSRPFLEAFSALTAILVAVVIFWGYAGFSQWLIIWEENLHGEVHWFIERQRAPWEAILVVLVLAHAAIPFATLIWTPAKKKPALVGSVCMLLLIGAVLHVWWLLLPGLSAGGMNWIDPAAMIGIGGLWTLTLARMLHLREQQHLHQTSGSSTEQPIHG